MDKYKRGLVWLRRDYRLVDHAALKEALNQCEQILVAFVFDTHILNKLKKEDQRISFIIDSLRCVDQELSQYGSRLIIRHGAPEEKIPEIITTYTVDALFFNRDYEPYAKSRDKKVQEAIPIPVYTYKDSVIFEKDEVLTKDGGHYKVFTPYKNQWLSKLNQEVMKPKSSSNHHFLPVSEDSSIHENRWFELLGFSITQSFLPGGRPHALQQLNKFKSKIQSYHIERDFPDLNHTSNISPYIRFGCLSIRELVMFALHYPSEGADIWLSELIWRDFYQMIVATHPNCHIESVKPAYDLIEWEGHDEDFMAWCNGQTGFPIVDAAMRQLNTTGLMHNRCRMIVASFLCKTLLVNWRKGEAYFAEKLLDFDFASNNGGWGWASSSGCDAQPYFRIFNPTSQSKKFDPDGRYIKTYCPELAHLSSKEIHDPPPIDGYPAPIVDYKLNRQRALAMYSVVKG
tara:strand:- start:4595 stop:5965 length:1371 start_codon:yes stop_codon:yes gene_type:complete